MQYIFLNYSLLRIFSWSFFVRASPFDYIGFSYVEHNSYLGPTGESSATFEENKKNKVIWIDACQITWLPHNTETQLRSSTSSRIFTFSSLPQFKLHDHYDN